MYKRRENARVKESRAAAVINQRNDDRRGVAGLMDNRALYRDYLIVQRHLFVDSPEDFTQLEDMGMWWGMACEWRNVKNLYGNKVSDNPRDYITSLVDVSAAKNNLKKGEQLRMLAHGYEGGTDVDIQNTRVEAKSKLDKISAVYEQKHGKKPTKKQLSPLHCFMGDPGGTMENIGKDKKGLGSGPVLIPSTGTVSFDQNAVLKGWSGGDFIDADGYWKKATDASALLPDLTKYKKSADDKSLLAAALDEVYLKINAEYIAFAGACKQTGRTQAAWPYLAKAVKPRAKSSGLCFITTACIQARGLPDDCETLTVLREFRDQYLAQIPDGPALIREYYRIAPKIVQRIDRGGNSRQVYDALYLLISRCVKSILAGSPETALAAYKCMVVDLKKEYLDPGDVATKEEN